MKISEFSVHRPVFAIVISLLLVVVGLVCLSRLWQTVREFPDINPPIVSIDTSYRGASAQIVETKITQPIEDRIAGVEMIDKLRSSSADERSRITVEFDLERNVDEAANDIRDRVGRVINDLPIEADPPEIAKADSNDDPIIYLNLSSSTMNVLDLTDFAERNIVDRFAALPGVARVQLTGSRRYAMRVWIDRQALAARAMTVGDIENALRRENVQVPAGRLESQQREFTLNTATGFDTDADFRSLVLGRGAGGYLVRLGEVASVELAAENERSVARTNGIPGINIGMVAQSKASALEVAHAVRNEVAVLSQDMPKGTQLAVHVDRAVFIEASMREVMIALGISLCLVLIVIYAFLGNWRATLIPAVTIPISIIAACAVMYALGFTINLLTLLGMVLAIGLVVDDAIVVLENIYRRIEHGEQSLLAAIDGSREIGFAVIATTLVLSAVFVPISFQTGRVGRLFSEFGFTLAAAILFSCLIALTLTPMMSSQLFAKGAMRSRTSELVDTAFGRLSGAYGRVLGRAISRPWMIIGAAAVLFAATILVFLQLPQETTPNEDRGVIRVLLTGPEGATMDYMERYARQLEDIMHAEAEHGDIKRYNTRIAPGGLSGNGEVNRAVGFIVLEDWGRRTRSASEIAAILQRKASLLPGVRASVFTPTAFNWGATAPVQAVLQGPDYEQLRQWSEKILKRAEQNPGLDNLDTDYKERKPQMKVSVDRNRAADLGVSLETIGHTLETMLGSRIVTTFIKQGREYYVILQGRSQDRASPNDLDNLYVRSDRTGELIPLSSMVRLDESATATQLNRFDRLRAITVSAGLANNYSMGEAIEFFRQAVKEELPPSAKLAFDGESREYLKSSSALYWTFLGALLIVFLVLAAQFESFTLPFVIMTTVPLAMVGAIVGLWLYGMSINIFSQIAIVMLVGLAAKNGVLIVEFANQLRDRGVEFVDAVRQASLTRLRPVLMTSLCSAFGSIPLLLAHGAGAESRQAIGVVVMWGVMLSMVLTLVVVPAVYAVTARNTRSPKYWTRIIERLKQAQPSSATESAPGARN
ncbi:MAG TPA: efflux RND transporter permease subunit [Steroidobacteraceae bacterium]|nr:efflux RND transporter permease subunit [Steroidobacteraceae bacterium]